MAAAAVDKRAAPNVHDQAEDMAVDAAGPSTEAVDAGDDLYTRFKTLQRQLEFLEIQVRIQRLVVCGMPWAACIGLFCVTSSSIASYTVVLQEDYIKEEQRNLKRELLRAQEEVKRIQSVPLVIGQFLEMIDTNSGIVGSTTGSNYYVRILSTLNRELLKPSSRCVLPRIHTNSSPSHPQCGAAPAQQRTGGHPAPRGRFQHLHAQPIRAA